MTLTLGTKLRLNDGREIPQLGFGVYQSPQGKMTVESVAEALRRGYRHVDTAALYRNEKDVGTAVRASGLAREQVFVTTKLWNADHGYDEALRAFDKSQKALGLDYVDLYLIHWPVQRLRLDSWRAFVRLQGEGRVRSIGVSNYTGKHLEELRAYSDVTPAVNQVELSVFLQQKQLRAYCAQRGIVVEAYSPLTKGERVDEPRLAAIANRHSKTPAQIMIRWCLESGTVPLPKSNTPSRIAENADVFDFALSQEDLAALAGLDEDYHTAWDPTDAP